MSENDKHLGYFSHRLLSGWSKVFGKKEGNDGCKISRQCNQELKSFPANHFFSQEELSFLSKNQDQCDLLQRWALQMSLWAKSKSNESDRNAPLFFPAVQWQDGLMSTWIDSEAIPENIDQQADRLYQLQTEGYELPPDFVRMIEARACRSLVSNLFIREDMTEVGKHQKTKSFIWINSVVDKVGEPLALSVFHYKKVSHHHTSEEIVSYKDFKSLIDRKGIAALTTEAQRKWNEQATERDHAERQFKELVSLMKRDNTYQGMFPANNSFIIHFEDGKDNIPVAWSLSDDKIKLDFDPRVSIDRTSLFVTSDESYLYVDILDFISKEISEKYYNQDLLAFIRVFGKDFCGDKVLSSGKRSFGKFSGVDINRITAKASDTIVAFNDETLETVSLSPDDRQPLLKTVIRHADMLLMELRTTLVHTTDNNSKELLQNKLDSIYHGLSAYNVDNKYQTLVELWQHILSMFDVQVAHPSLVSKSDTKQSKTKPEELSISRQSDSMPEKETITSSDEIATVSAEEVHPRDTVEEFPESKPTPQLLTEGYIYIAPSSKGRWHTPDMMLREAYRVFGKLLSGKLQKLLDNEKSPWVSKAMMVPRDCSGTVYTGANAIMLALWTEEQGFELPFFITEDEIRTKGLGILQDVESLFILDKGEAARVYNIAQTTFTITQKRAYESLKLNMIASERKKTSGYQFLDSDAFCKIPLQFDGIPNLSVYSYADKVIHIAPKDSFTIEDDYYRDLAVAMVESTREVDFDTLRLDTYLFENLVSHLGSGMISQSCRFDATNPEYSRIWRERLENNPEYTKRILEQSDTASVQVLQMALA